MNAKHNFVGGRVLPNEASRTTNAAHGAQGEYFQVNYCNKHPIDVVVWVEVGGLHTTSRTPN